MGNYWCLSYLVDLPAGFPTVSVNWWQFSFHSVCVDPHAGCATVSANWWRKQVSFHSVCVNPINEWIFPEKMQACLTCLVPKLLFMSHHFAYFRPTDLDLTLNHNYMVRANISKFQYFLSTVSTFWATAPRRKWCLVGAKPPFISVLLHQSVLHDIALNTFTNATDRRRVPLILWKIRHVVFRA